MSRRIRRTVLGVAAALVLVGCGTGIDADAKNTTGPKASDRSVAALTIDTIGEPVAYATVGDRRYNKAKVASLVKFQPTPEGDTPTVDTRVLPTDSKYARSSCDDGGSDDGCEETTLDDGRTVLVAWRLDEPEEDPGILNIVVSGENEFTQVEFSGPRLMKDPRDGGALPAGFEYEKLLELAVSADLGSRTARKYVDLGDALDTWEQEPPPTGPGD